MAQGHLLAGRYRLDAVVGQGGMGTVWRAYDVTLDREVAVKEVVLPPGLSAAERDILYERTFREARASARLNHPGVVTVHDVVEESGRPWIVMELVHASSLQDLIEEATPVDHQRVAEIGLQMLAALRHAHEKGILHRDVKPSNVLITDAGRVVLTDFGIAQVEGDSTLTQTGLVMGSPAYIPPERAQGERAVPASDLWALGATLYTMLEGRAPYERPDAMAALQAALVEAVPPARNAGPLETVLEGLLAREPHRRMRPEQAQPMLAHVATMPRPMPPPPPAPPRVGEDTVLDDPTGGQDSTIMDEAAETLLDDETRQDRGTGAPQAPPPSTAFDRGSGGQAPAYNQASNQAPPYNQAPAPQPRPNPEVRTVMETEWAPPPGGSPITPPPGPSTPPPWENPAQSAHWQQPHPPAARGRGPDQERRLTIVIVTIAVVLVVAAVLAGALILRDKLNSGSASSMSASTVETGRPGV